MTISKRAARWLQGAYDIHIHAGPDVVPRAQDMLAIAGDAEAAGMAGLVFKDHTGSTAHGVHVVNQLHAGGVQSYSALCLNPPVGGLNPHAVAAALAEGVRMVYFPTKAAAYEFAVKGPTNFPVLYPPEAEGFEGIRVTDDEGKLLPEVEAILALLAEHDAVLATGHVSPDEALALVRGGAAAGVSRMVVTHASEPVPGLSVGQQRQAVEMGAVIEHCLLAVVLERPMGLLVEQIQAVGATHCVVSSDFGQAANGPVIPGFARYLERMADAGVPEDALRTMILDVPRRLLE